MLVVSVACQRHFRAAQLVLDGRHPFRRIISVGVFLRACRLSARRMGMRHRGRLAREGVGGLRHLVAAQEKKPP